MATRRQLLFMAGGAVLRVGAIRAVPTIDDRSKGFEFIGLDRPAGSPRLASGGSITLSEVGFDFRPASSPSIRVLPG